MMEQGKGQLLFERGLIGRRDGDMSFFGRIHHQFGFWDVFQIEQFKETIEQADAPWPVWIWRKRPSSEKWIARGSTQKA